jgi:hypothetical protein
MQYSYNTANVIADGTVLLFEFDDANNGYKIPVVLTSPPPDEILIPVSGMRPPVISAADFTTAELGVNGTTEVSWYVYFILTFSAHLYNRFIRTYVPTDFHYVSSTFIVCLSAAEILARSSVIFFLCTSTCIFPN